MDVCLVDHANYPLGRHKVDINTFSPESHPAIEVLRRSPLEAHHPHGVGLTTVGHCGLESLVTVQILRL